MTGEKRSLLGDVPTLKKSTVWHIGTTILAQKQPNSHAGRGLAVSQEPDSWRYIAKLAGPLFRLEKENGVFADMYACFRSPYLMQNVWDWTLKEGYVRWQQLYALEYYESETHQWRTLSFVDETQALIEYHALQDDTSEARYTPFLGYAPTERMQREVEHTMPPLAFVQDFAMFLFLETFSQLDGVWWPDSHQPELLSAPHGAIFRHHIASWRKERA